MVSCVKDFQRGSCKGQGERASEDRRVQVELGAKRVEEGRGERDSERLYLGGNHFGVAA